MFGAGQKGAFHTVTIKYVDNKQYTDGTANRNYGKFAVYTLGGKIEYYSSIKQFLKDENAYNKNSGKYSVFYCALMKAVRL